jgi:Cys-rich protein (TIGR01571 family)
MAQEYSNAAGQPGAPPPGYAQPGMVPGYGQPGMAPGYGQPGMPPQPGQPGYGQPGMAPQPGMVQPAGMAPQAGVAAPAGQWTSGLYDCFNDLPSCLITYFCTCVGHGFVVHRVEGGGWGMPAALFWLTSPCCLECCLWGPQRRERLRKKYGLPEEPCNGAALPSLAHCTPLSRPTHSLRFAFLHLQLTAACCTALTSQTHAHVA